MRTLTKKSFLIFSLTLLTFTCGALTVSFADIPRTLNFQAKLTDKNGTPLNGSYQIKLALYDAQTGGNLLWQETQTASVQDGIANLILGSVTALNLAFNKPYWLSITIGTETLPERQPISSSAYALNTERLGGIASTSILASDTSGNVTLKGSLAASNRNCVGLEYNILFNANNRYTVTQAGPAAFDLATLFDAKLAPYYSTNGPSIANPQIITIENLPATHTQAAAWVGWTTRFWPPAKFKIEGYDAYNSANVWRVLADYSTTAYTGYDFLVKINPSGSYTKLKLTIYEGTGTADASGNKRVGLSEILFIHPEANRPYSGLLPSNMWESKNGNVGIGTAAPDGKLHITAALNNWTSNAWRKGIRLDDINAIEFGGGGTTKYGIGQSGNKLFFFDTTVEDNTAAANYRMIISGGNVGVGTATPAAKLHVKGDAIIEGTYLKIPVVTADPTSPQDGMIWYNSTESSFKCRQAGVTKKFVVQ